MRRPCGSGIKPDARFQGDHRRVLPEIRGISRPAHTFRSQRQDLDLDEVAPG
jgi:hypothetical protein